MADFNRIETAGNIVRRVLGSLGLPQPADVVEATDATSRQMLALLVECGQDLVADFDWQVLDKTHEFTTTAATEYDLPEDWERYVDDAGWNNTGRMPLLGPLSAQQWRMLEARQLGGTTLRLQYVIENNKIVLYFAPSPAQTLAISYISRGWVEDAADPAIRRDYVANDADKVLFRPRLMVSFLKYKWREAKGFDASAAYMEYQNALDAAKYSDKPKSSLQISGRQGFPYLGYVNMPDTGFGNG
jgi:hypothetical protein